MTRRPPPRRKRETGGAWEEHDLTIAKLGSQGVGVAFHAGKALLLSDTLPGERVRVAIRGGEARVLVRLSDSDDRIVPPCRHFGVCGGCAVQHLTDSAYRHFKQGLIVDALRRQGLGEVIVDQPMVSPPGTRRRASLEASRHGNQIVLGFHGRSSHTIVDLRACPVLAPALVDLCAPLRRLLMLCLRSGERATVILSALDEGIDLGLQLPRLPDLAGLEAMADFAAMQDLARVWWRTGDEPPTPASVRRQPSTRFGDIMVDPPMGGFLQATVAGQNALIEIVTKAVSGAGLVADLFAGCGTFSLPIALAGARVHAIESVAEPLAALSAAARRARLTDVTVERRDLEARPLIGAELSRFDAVVFDPPRAGARAQAEELAQADLGIAVGVSCNPATFARDAAILVAGGWRLDRVTPIDQFLWSSHLELVGVFRRGQI